MQLIRQQYPHLDIRFVLQTPNAKLTKTVTKADLVREKRLPVVQGAGDSRRLAETQARRQEQAGIRGGNGNNTP